MKKIEFRGNKNVIGTQLRRIRGDQDLTQEQLAAKLQTLDASMDQQMVSKIENNTRMVTDYELGCFCKVLGVSESEMMKDFYAMLDS